MNRTAENYLRWLQAGNESDHFDAVRAALPNEPQTRREIAERAGVSVNFTATALDVLIALGEAEQRGTRGGKRGKWEPAKLYARRQLPQLSVHFGLDPHGTMRAQDGAA